MSFRESLTEQWFEVVERWTDARGKREAIIFCGPLKECQNIMNWGSGDLIIRPVTF